MKLGNYTQAIQYLDKALVIDPHDKYALNNKGFALESLGNHTQAIQSFDIALAVDSDFKSALNNKGTALESLGNHTQAIRYYDRILALDPNDTYWRSNACLSQPPHVAAASYGQTYLS